MKVVGVTSGGASPNRTMYRMHLHMTCIMDMSVDVDVTYRTLNIMAEEERYIYFISDPPHFIKTVRNFFFIIMHFFLSRDDNNPRRVN